MSKGDFPLDITWSHNSYNISPVEGVTITRPSRKIGQLIIDSVQASNAGIYTCIAKNKAGEAKHSAILNVNGDLCLLRSCIVEISSFCFTNFFLNPCLILSHFSLKVFKDIFEKMKKLKLIIRQ